MTDKQIKQAKEKLRKENVRFLDPRNVELDCRDMINSIMCYAPSLDIKEIQSNLYLDSYRKELGSETVNRLIDEQLEDFKKATVMHNVYIDSEGCSYNSIIWAD